MTPPTYEGLSPIEWPQDTLQVPGVGTRMPPLDPNNANFTGGEAFTMIGQLLAAPNTAYPPGSQIEAILPTDQDGDFWCRQIYLQNPYAYTAPLQNVSVDIVDIRTGLFLTYPRGMPVQFLDNNGVFTNAKGALAGGLMPEGFRSTGILQQPYCFTRQGGIKLVWTINSTIASVATPVPLIFIAFGGWKEYTHAAT